MSTITDLNLKETIREISEDSCPYVYNLHCHTTFSDGSLSPTELITQAKNIRLKYLAVTDHHSIASYPIIKKWYIDNRNINNLPILFSGIEISAVLSGCLVHILGLGFDVTSKLLLPYLHGESARGNALQAANVIKAIKESKGISILAHPGRYRVNYNDLIAESIKLGIDGVEVWYDYDFKSQWQASELICKSIELLADKYNLLKTCGTDTHGYSLLGR